LKLSHTLFDSNGHLAVSERTPIHTVHTEAETDQPIN